jgi:ribonuclease P protein component
MAERRFTYPRSRRLSGKLSFAATFNANVRESRGPLTVFAKPNNLPHPRLGLSVSRSVGTAVRRNCIKRRLREAFRLLQCDLPRGYDLVVVVRRHEPFRLPEYQKLLSALFVKLHAAWARRETSS